MQSKETLDQLVWLLLLCLNQAAEDGCSSKPNGDIERRAAGTTREQFDVGLIENHEAVEFGSQLIEMGAGIAFLFINERADDLESKLGYVRIHQFARTHAPNLGQRPGEHAAFRVASGFVSRLPETTLETRLACLDEPGSVSAKGVVRVLPSRSEPLS